MKKTEQELSTKQEIRLSIPDGTISENVVYMAKLAHFFVIVLINSLIFCIMHVNEG